MSKHIYELTIKEFHLDTLGHMNNAMYLSIFEEARWELITSNNYGLKEIQKLNKGPVILEVAVKFLKELKLREKVKIMTEILEYSSKVGKLKQWIEKENGEVACEAVFVFSLFDLLERKLISPTPEWLKGIGFEK